MGILNILLIEDETANTLLGKILVTNGYSVINTATLPASNIQDLLLENKTDLVVFNINSPQNDLNRKHAFPIAIFAADDTADAINQVVKADISAYGVNGLEASRITGIVNIAMARFKEQQRLEIELETTKSKLEERKLINRAKGILTKTRSFTEDDAYHSLRKLAMDRIGGNGEKRYFHG